MIKWMLILLVVSSAYAGTIQTITTDASATPTTTQITLSGNALRVWTGEPPRASFWEPGFNLYYRRNGGAVQTVRLYRYQGRILNAAAGDVIAIGSDDGRQLKIADMTVPVNLIASFPTNATANCDKAGPPLWVPGNAHITLPANNSAFQIASNQQERVIFISEFDGSVWSPPRWVWTQTNFNTSVQCNYQQIALANYDGALLSVNCPAGSTIGGTSNYMMFSLPTVTGTTRNVSTVPQFHAAIAAAVAGDEIVLSDGLYQLTNKISATSFAANNGVGGRHGAEGITIRSSSGNRNGVWITGTNSATECGWTLTQTGAADPTYFKDITFVATNCTYSFVVSDGQFKFGNVRMTGPSLGNTGWAGSAFVGAGTSVVDFVQCQIDTTLGDCYDNLSTTNMRLISCSGFTSGSVNSDQIVSSHAGSYIQCYGCYLSDAGANVSQCDNASSNFLYFCVTDPGARSHGGLQQSSLFANRHVLSTSGSVYSSVKQSAFIEFNHFYLTNTGTIFDGTVATPLAHNLFNMITNATTEVIEVVGDGMTNCFGNISVGGSVHYQDRTTGTLNPTYCFNNTLIGPGPAGTGLWPNVTAAPYSPFYFTNNASLGLVQGIKVPNSSQAQVSTNQGDYNVFCGSHDYYDLYGTNAHEVFASADIDSTTYFPIGLGNCDGTGCTTTWAWVGDTDPFGLVFIYSSLKIPRGARNIAGIYPSAVLFPDFYAAPRGTFTWYVRPTGAGAKNGTSYADAWSSITNIQWGGAGVNSGDTIYCCGTNIASLTNADEYYNTTIADIGVSGITIRGDYPNDPYVAFAGALDHINALTWLGPDANGIYWTTNEVIGTHMRECGYEIDNNQIYYLTPQTNKTWTGGLGGKYYDGVTNFVKTVSGNAPSNNIAVMAGGWTWNLNAQSNITFLNFIGIGEWLQQNGSGWIPPSPFTAGPKFITFDGVTNLYAGFNLYPGNDNFTWRNCEIGFVPFGIYAYLNSGTRGAWNGVVSNCFIHDTYIEPGSGANQDLHGIGLQGTCNWTIVNNEVARTGGTAIDFYSGGAMVTNNTVAKNFIHDITGVINDGSGIGCDSGVPTALGRHAGFRVYDNIINHTGIAGGYGRTGIGLNCGDPVFICNNTISYCDVGIYLYSQTNPIAGTIANNIIVNPTNTFIFLSGTGSSTAICDYNLYFTNAVIATPFNISPSFTHDTHSVFANPQFVSNNPSSVLDFSIKPNSPATDSGLYVGLVTDYAGMPFNNPPSIGAFESRGMSRFTTMRIGKAIFGP